MMDRGSVAVFALLSLQCGVLHDDGPSPAEVSEAGSLGAAATYFLTRDGVVVQYAYRGIGAWRSFGAPTTLTMGLASDGREAYVVDSSGNLWHLTAGEWVLIYNESNLSGVPAATRVRVSDGTIERYLVAANTDGAAVALTNNEDAWSAQTLPTPGSTLSPPLRILHFFNEDGSQQVTGLARTTAGHVIEHTLRGGMWTQTRHFDGADIRGPPCTDVVYTPLPFVDLFAVDGAGDLRRKAYVDDMWDQTDTIIGRPERTPLIGGVATVSHTALARQLTHAFAVGQDGRLYEFRWASHQRRWRSHEGPSSLVGNVRAVQYVEEDERVLRVWVVDDEGRIHEGVSRLRSKCGSTTKSNGLGWSMTTAPISPCDTGPGFGSRAPVGAILGGGGIANFGQARGRPRRPSYKTDGTGGGPNPKRRVYAIILPGTVERARSVRFALLTSWMDPSLILLDGSESVTPSRRLDSWLGGAAGRHPGL